MNNSEQISVNLLKTETIGYAGQQKSVQMIAVAEMEIPIYEKHSKTKSVKWIKTKSRHRFAEFFKTDWQIHLSLCRILQRL